MANADLSTPAPVTAEVHRTVGHVFREVHAIVQMAAAATLQSVDEVGLGGLAEPLRLSIDRARELLREAEDFWDKRRIKVVDQYDFETSFYQASAMLSLLDQGAFDGGGAIRVESQALENMLLAIASCLDLTIGLFKEVQVADLAAA